VRADPIADRNDLHALQAGDDRGLDRLISRWEQPLFAFAWRYVRNSADAHDLTVEIFVRLHQQRAHLRPDSNLAAWLFSSLANLCRNHHRWRQRHPGLSLDASAPGEEGASIAQGLPETGPTPAETLEQQEAIDQLGAAIDRLPHELKTTLLLHHFEQHSYREIADITGCSERGVETRLYRARRALESEMARYRRETAAP